MPQPQLVEKLRELSRNLWWTWQPSVIALFRELDPALWRKVDHNPVEFLKALPVHQLERRAAEMALHSRIDYAFRRLAEYLKNTDSWGAVHASILRSRPVAYFCAEFGLHESLPIYSGGVGVLAGDHLKSASDLGIPLIGIGLLYAQGYFHQWLNAEGWQQELYLNTDLDMLPIESIMGPDGQPLQVAIETATGVLRARVWRAEVGRTTLLLLDSNVPENGESDRALTARLYGGDARVRIRQELLLGVGGVRALHALGIHPSVLHLNEGHSAFATVEMIRAMMEETGLPFGEVMRDVAGMTVFTTHTPVAAGHDRFPPSLVEEHLRRLREGLNLLYEDFMGLGRVNAADPNELFCMTVLALKLSRYANGVSALHGVVSRRMWHPLYPNMPEESVPIGHITNAVHAQTWVAPEMAIMFDRHLGTDWLRNQRLPETWEGIQTIDDFEFWEAQQVLKARMINFVRDRLVSQARRRNEPDSEVQKAMEALDLSALTIGFARRFATYKRAVLILQDVERLTDLIKATDRPVQIIFAGKAHPEDRMGKELIQAIVRMTKQDRFLNRIAFIEDYDMNVARQLVQGVDVWLNTPRRPQEASGTSGQKAIFNGTLNFSILDGWWAEAYDGTNGFVIGIGRIHANPSVQDERDHRSLMDTLTNQVVPLYYQRDATGLPRAWIARQKNALRTLAWRFNSDRMVMEYVNGAYLRHIAAQQGYYPTPLTKEVNTSLVIAQGRIDDARTLRARTLDLSGLGLKELPETLGQLSQLEELNASDNHLTVLPKSIGMLTNLRRVFLAKNKFGEFPQVLCKLTNLTLLALGGNPLAELPESIGRLRNLELLDLSCEHEVILYWNPQWSLMEEWIGESDQRGNLSQLPKSLREIGSLRELYLHGNDGLGLLSERIGPSWNKVASKRETPRQAAEILEYYFRLQEHDRYTLNEARLILVGHGGVGKTSLFNRLLYDTFDRDEDRTDGIQIAEWRLRLKGEESVRLNVWDFGGQELMHATHQFFLTQRSIYLLVLNGRGGREDSDAEYWLKLIESLGAESPVLVVLNKIKKDPFKLSRGVLREKYPFIRDFIETDCEDRTGIAELRAAIEYVTDRLEHLRHPFPANWFAIKDRLAGMNENYLTFDRFRAICVEHGENEAAAQEELASCLHVLGVALNYRDDPRLRDTHVLNPHWVTNGIYKILTAPTVAANSGVLHVTELSQFLDPQQYPRNMHNFLLDLMKKFEICVRFLDEDESYLIPELLGEEEPEETKEFRAVDCLNFQYHYPILPVGLIPRFIVRTHVSRKRLPCWRTGVILEFEDNKALVKADVQDNKVFISVKGNPKGRRRLLAIIRADFESIHASLYKFQPVEMVPLPGDPDLVVPYRKLQLLEANGIAWWPDVFGDDLVELNVQLLLNGVDMEGTRKPPTPGKIRQVDLVSARGAPDLAVPFRELQAGETSGTRYGDEIDGSDVPQLANSMDLEGARRSVSAREREGPTLRLFISYSRADEGLSKELKAHLTLLKRQRLIATWDNQEVEAGQEWKQQIDENLEHADIILLLVSADFINSNYCYETEGKRALERNDAGEARVIPVILRPVDWEIASFSKLQVLPKNAVAVTEWPSRDSAWQDVVEGIREVVGETRDARARS